MTALLQEAGETDVEIVDGRFGEMTVLVDGAVAAKSNPIFPSRPETLVTKVRKALAAG